MIYGFTVMNLERSALVFAAFDLYSDQHVAEPTVDEFSAAVNALEKVDSLDAAVLTNQRVEQSFVRRHHFGNKVTSHCGIYGREYPVTFLVAAHIKNARNVHWGRN